MSHPTNKRDRFKKGSNKGSRRAHHLLSPSDKMKHPELVKKTSQKLRETTKLCSCYMCQKWSNKKYKLDKDKTWELI